MGSPVIDVESTVGFSVEGCVAARYELAMWPDSTDEDALLLSDAEGL